MAKFRSQMNRVTSAADAMEKPKYVVEGFKFVLDGGEDEPREILEPLPGMPRISCFLYEFEGKLYGG